MTARTVGDAVTRPVDVVASTSILGSSAAGRSPALEAATTRYADAGIG